MATEKTFIADDGHAERVHASIVVTPELLADEAAFALYIGRELRTILLDGKSVFVKVSRSIDNS